MEKHIINRHITHNTDNHKWYKDTFIFLGNYPDKNTGYTYDLYFGYERIDKDDKMFSDHEFSTHPIGVAVYDKWDSYIFESTLQTCLHQYPQKGIFDEIRSRAVRMNLIPVEYLEFNTVLEKTKSIRLNMAGWSKVGSGWKLSDNTTIDTDAAYDILILSKIKKKKQI